MTNQQAIEILESLMEGFDPDSDVPFAKDSIFRKPKVALALHNAINALYQCNDSSTRLKRPSPKEKKIAVNRNKPWTITDDEILEMLYYDNAPLQHICSELGRTPEGVRMRMVHIGLINSREEYPAPRNKVMRYREVWSYDDIVELEQMVAEGKSIPQLAERFNSTEKAIQARLFYMGLSTKAPDLHLKPKDKT